MNMHKLVVPALVGLAMSFGCAGEVKIGDKPPETPKAPEPPVAVAVPAPAPAPAPAPEAPPPAKPRGIVLKGIATKGNQIDMPGDIEFDLDKATIKDTPKTQEVLTKLLAVMKDNPQLTKLRIEGHTDDQGKKDYNKTLSDKRAAAVATWLGEKGIDKSRLQTVGLGMEKPVVPNDSADNRAKNRRTEFHIVELEGKAVPVEEKSDTAAAAGDKAPETGAGNSAAAKANSKAVTPAKAAPAAPAKPAPAAPAKPAKPAPTGAVKPTPAPAHH